MLIFAQLGISGNPLFSGCAERSRIVAAAPSIRTPREKADEAMLRAWRPVAQRLAELVRGRRGSVPLATAVAILGEDRDSH